MKQHLLEMFQVTVWLYTDNSFSLGFTKTKTGAKTAPGRKTELPRRVGLSARIKHGTPTAGVIGHIHMYSVENSFEDFVWKISYDLLQLILRVLTYLLIVIVYTDIRLV